MSTESLSRSPYVDLTLKAGKRLLPYMWETPKAAVLALIPEGSLSRSFLVGRLRVNTKSLLLGTRMTGGPLILMKLIV